MSTNKKDTRPARGAAACKKMRHRHHDATPQLPKEVWLPRLETLVVKFPSLGLSPDLAALTIIELWGVYCLLERLAATGGT